MPAGHRWRCVLAGPLIVGFLLIASFYVVVSSRAACQVLGGRAEPCIGAANKCHQVLAESAMKQLIDAICITCTSI